MNVLMMLVLFLMITSAYGHGDGEDEADKHCVCRSRSRQRNLPKKTGICCDVSDVKGTKEFSEPGKGVPVTICVLDKDKVKARKKFGKCCNDKTPNDDSVVGRCIKKKHEENDQDDTE